MPKKIFGKVEEIVFIAANIAPLYTRQVYFMYTQQQQMFLTSFSISNWKLQMWKLSHTAQSARNPYLPVAPRLEFYRDSSLISPLIPAAWMIGKF